MPFKRGNFRDRKPGKSTRGSGTFKFSQQKREYRHQEQLTEPEVGIVEYLNDCEGFFGIIKARYSDFQVNEIDLDGKIAKLTDTSIPKDFEMASAKVSYKEMQESPTQYISQEIWDKIRALANKETTDPVYIDVDKSDKQVRYEIHTTVKDYFKRKIVASTIDKDGVKCIEIKAFNKDDKDDNRHQWPSDKGEYVHFLLYKEATDTMEAAMKLSHSIKIKTSKFSYAGVKDKRAKTTQWFCVRKVPPWKLITKVNKNPRIQVGNITFKDEPLQLGQLKGNKFRIALRNVLASDELIGKSLEQVKEKGFVNYYGLQRFGNDKEAPTFEIGKCLLQGKWKEAIQLILKVKASDDPWQDIPRAKKIYSETGNAKKAFEVVKQKSCLEAKLLEGLCKGHENDFVNALENMPRNSRLLYMHSLQSLIWNKMVSKRLQLFGMKPVVGDLVLVEQNEEQIVEESDLTSNDTDVNETAEDSDDEETKKEEEFTCKSQVKALTEEDLPNYTIYDIVLPLPGYNVSYPDHMTEHYKEALVECGLTLEMPKQSVRTYTLCGDYRPMLRTVQDLSWKIMMYNEATDNLIRSDLEELRGNPEPASIKDGQYKALILEFSLAPSSYATMLLRELLKSNTSSSVQAKYNEYYKANQDKKILIGLESAENSEKSDNTNPQNSLLSNPEKYAEFKNSIFKDILGTAKRPNEEEEEKSTKKAKLEETNSENSDATMESASV